MNNLLIWGIILLLCIIGVMIFIRLIKTALYVLVLTVLALIVFSLYNQLSHASCEDILSDNTSLQIQLDYCAGTLCTFSCIGSVCQNTTSDTCGTIDLVDDMIDPDPDGKADCAWLENACLPNK